MSDKSREWLTSILIILAAICAIGSMVMLSLKEGG